MEILHKPALHNSAHAAAWSGWSSPTAAAGGGGGSSCGRNCCPSLPVPKITSWARGVGLGFPSAPRTVGRCRGGGLLSITARHAPLMASCRVCPALFRAEHYCERYSRRRQTVGVVMVGVSSEKLEPVCGVVQFRLCGGSIRRGAVIVAVSSVNGWDKSIGGGEGNLDLELEVFEFMQQSGKPDAFPSRRDLISAGRTDLAMAIEEEGGWLAAGWDEEGDEEGEVAAAAAVVEVEEKDSSWPKLSKRKYKARSLKRSSSSSVAAGKSSRVRTSERSGRIAERQLHGANVVREVENAVDDNDGQWVHDCSRRKGNRLTMLNTDDSEPVEDFSILERPSHNRKSAVVRGTKHSSRRGTRNAELQVLERISSLLSLAEELTLKRPQGEHQLRRSLGQDSERNDFAKSAIETTIPNKSFSNKNGSLLEAPRGETSVTSLRDAVADVEAQPERKRRVREKVKAHVVDDKSTTDEVNGNTDLLREIIYEGEMLMLDMRLKGDESSLQNRLHSLAASRAEKSCGKQEMVHQEVLSEFIDAEDTLEFRENGIMQARNELLTTRAQVAALEGNSEVEMMEARKILEEKNLRIERARSASRRLRQACVVWPNHANEVFLTGSFNGWNGQIKMEKSNAGVFAVSLPFYPGKYEIKFIVDGSWRVDTQRPIVYVGGFENNVLTVS